jgi:hypothetical protein
MDLSIKRYSNANSFIRTLAQLVLFQIVKHLLHILVLLQLVNQL